MQCLHPNCPRGRGLQSWAHVLALPDLKIKGSDRAPLLAALATCGPLTHVGNIPSTMLKRSVFKRLLACCPCLYVQVPIKVSARAVVHLCEVTLGQDIVSNNVYQAFEIQHPSMPHTPFLHQPMISGASGGDIMEAFCSEVLDNHGVPHVKKDADGWPIWTTRSHVSLNSGKMQPLKLYGDILIPCAPHNLLISVKSEAARERFIVSGNRLESVGFGFFSEAREFWTSSRMNLLKRWGFIAIYMPHTTLHKIEHHLNSVGTTSDATNINGRPLFRSLAEFGGDMHRIAGKLSLSI